MTLHPEIKKRFSRDPKEIYKRDNFKCVICGSNKKLSIDHIDGNGRYSKYPNNNIDNLRTLCLSCHGSIDGKRGSKKRWPVKRSKIHICIVCKKKFSLYFYQIKRGCGKYCSNNCRYGRG